MTEARYKNRFRIIEFKKSMGVYITMKEGQHEYNRINLKSVVAVFLLVFCTFFDAAAQASGTFTDSRDERSYKWIKIGDQTWMAENLSYKPESEGWFIYDNKEENYNQYGCLYTWETAKMSVLPVGTFRIRIICGNYLPTSDVMQAVN